MSQQLAAFEKTLVAGEAMTDKKYYIVQLDASGNLEVGEGPLDLLVGVLQNEPDAGEAALYRHSGTSKVISNGSVAIGDWVTSHTNGKAKTTTTDGDIVIGRALEAGTADGDIFECQLSIHHLYIA